MTGSFPPPPPGSNKKRGWRRQIDREQERESSCTYTHKYFHWHKIHVAHTYYAHGHTLHHNHYLPFLTYAQTHTRAHRNRPLPPFSLFVAGVCVQFMFPQYYSETFPGSLIHLGPCWWWRLEWRGHLIPGGAQQQATRVRPLRKPYIRAQLEPVTSVSVMRTLSDISQTQRRQRHVPFGSMKANKSYFKWTQILCLIKTTQTAGVRATAGGALTSQIKRRKIFVSAKIQE